MIYIESPSTNPYWNLAMEEYLFAHTERGMPCFMLWQNEKTIVVGKYQNTAEEINQRYVDEHGIRIARRLSGGGAVYHDLGNLNYTFIVDQDEGENFDFKTFARPVIAALEQFGVSAEFSGRNDLTIEGQKFSGCAQYACGGRLLHHGCIMLNSDLGAVAYSLQPSSDKFQSKSIKSVRSRVTTINSHAPRPITIESFKRALVTQLEQHVGLIPRRLTARENTEILELKDQKYASWDWIYGASPDYAVCKKRRFLFGTVEVRLNVSRGHVTGLRFSGDFFGNGDIRQLESAMIGLPMDRRMLERLSNHNVSYYINGMTGDALYGLIMY